MGMTAFATPSTRRIRASERIAQASVAAGAVAGAVILRTMPVRSLGLPQCPVRHYLGLDCPGCGVTRALSALSHGHVASAVDHNALAMVFLPIIVAAFVMWVVPSAKPAWVTRVASSPLTPRIIFAVVIVFTVVRNLPVFGGYLRSS